MLNLLAGFLSPFAVPLAAGGGILITLLCAWFYNAWFDNPAVIREARKDFVQISEVSALKAQLDREKAIRLLSNKVVTDHIQMLSEIHRKEAQEDERIEKEIGDYEQKLRDDDRECLLDQPDIDWLRKP